MLYNWYVTRSDGEDAGCESIAALDSTGFFTLFSCTLQRNQIEKKITKGYKKVVPDFFSICNNLINKGKTTKQIWTKFIPTRKAVRNIFIKIFL